MWARLQASQAVKDIVIEMSREVPGTRPATMMLSRKNFRIYRHDCQAIAVGRICAFLKD